MHSNPRDPSRFLTIILLHFTGPAARLYIFSGWTDGWLVGTYVLSGWTDGWLVGTVPGQQPVPPVEREFEAAEGEQDERLLPLDEAKPALLRRPYEGRALQEGGRL
eukprot:3484068-Pyramimonas_sp.AAC.1